MAWTWRWPVALVLGALVVPAVAQSSHNESNTVLHEVRLLRQAIETLARSSVSAHISFGRLQIQEQRTVSESTRLRAIADELSAVSMRIEHLAESMKRFEEEAVNRLDGAALREREAHAEYLKEEREALERRRHVLSLERVDAEQRLALEQAHWAELSQKLDELERALAPRPR